MSEDLRCCLGVMAGLTLIMAAGVVGLGAGHLTPGVTVLIVLGGGMLGFWTYRWRAYGRNHGG